MTLGRPAVGLPRYYLDCGWHRHPRFTGLSSEALFCWQAGVGYCNQHSTDGRMPADPEELSLALGVRLSWVRKAIRELVARDLWVPAGAVLIVDGYVDHNPVAAEVAEHAERQRSRGSVGNHKRWHVGRGISDPGCPYCQSPGDSRLATSPEGSSPGDIALGESPAIENRPSDPPPNPPKSSPAISQPDLGKHPPPDTPTDRTRSPAITGDDQGKHPPKPIAGESLGMGWDGMGTSDNSFANSLQGDVAGDPSPGDNRFPQLRSALRIAPTSDATSTPEDAA